MTTPKVPEPENKTAYLLSNGIYKMTRHTYVETRPVTLPGPDGEAYEHIFKCEETGALKRWGSVDPRVCK